MGCGAFPHDGGGERPLHFPVPDLFRTRHFQKRKIMDTPASLTSKRIGCIGCGNMGGAILGGLAEVPGLELYGYNRTPQRLEPLCAKGVTAVPGYPRTRPPAATSSHRGEALPRRRRARRSPALPEAGNRHHFHRRPGSRCTICATRYRAAAMWCASCRIPPPSWAQACSASRRIRRCPKTCSP